MSDHHASDPGKLANVSDLHEIGDNYEVTL